MLRKEKTDFWHDTGRAILVGVFIMFPLGLAITYVSGLQEQAAQQMEEH